MEDFLTEPNTDIVTPESLAWKILMDKNIEDYEGIIMPFVTYDNDSSKTRYDDISAQFEILITIYMEMVFYVLKINHINSKMNEEDHIDDKTDLESDFNPEFDKFDVKDMRDIFQEKFKKIRIFLSIREVDDDGMNDSKNFGSENEYYCRILLKHIPENKTYFWNNRKSIDPKKWYTFIIRDDKTQHKLEDFYAVCKLPHKKFRISFSIINIITK